MNIGIYIYDQAEVLDFAGPFEVFSTASIRQQFPQLEVWGGRRWVDAETVVTSGINLSRDRLTVPGIGLL